MRHRVCKKKLNRPRSHRMAMIKNLMRSLFIHGSIMTTTAKAKAVRPYVEKLITKAKAGNLHARRMVNRWLNDRRLTNKVVDEIAKRYIDRPGGYTRIIKVGNRKGDGAEMAILQLVEGEEE